SSTSVSVPAARAAQSARLAGSPGGRCPDTTENDWPTSRWVSGMPASAGPAVELYSPGIPGPGPPAAPPAAPPPPPPPRPAPPPRLEGVPDRRRADPGRAGLLAPRCLPRVDEQAPRPQPGGQRGVAQPVRDHHVGGVQRPPPPHRDQVSAARPGPDQC